MLFQFIRTFTSINCFKGVLNLYGYSTLKITLLSTITVSLSLILCFKVFKIFTKSHTPSALVSEPYDLGSFQPEIPDE